MKQVFEFSFFLAGATVLHLSVGLIAPDGQSAAEGEGGDAAITLVAASASVQDMVAAWEAPVTVTQEVAQPAAHPMAEPTDAPSLALPEPEVSPSTTPSALPSPAGDAPALPQIDRSVPPPPAPPAMAQVRPVERPEVRPAPAAKPAAPKPTQAKPATTQQSAAGSGTRKTAGTGAAPAARTTKPGNAKQLLATWGAQIRNSIERRKRYPAGTRARGTVTLAISVHTGGSVAGVTVRTSSGVAQIDRAAVAAVTSARIAAAPEGVAAGAHTFTLPMTFAP